MVRIQECVTKVPIRKGIRAYLEPNNNCVDFRNRPYERMVDIIVYHNASDQQG